MRGGEEWGERCMKLEGEPPFYWFTRSGEVHKERINGVRSNIFRGQDLSFIKHGTDMKRP